MKHLTLIIHTNAQQDMADQLRSLKQVSGFTFNHAEGHGVQVESDPFLSARDKVVGYTPRIRVDILLEGGDVDLVLESLRKTTYGVEGQGIYWVTAVEQSGHL
jgi:nitrogen regulatory protein P-II 1